MPRGEQTKGCWEFCCTCNKQTSLCIPWLHWLLSEVCPWSCDTCTIPDRPHQTAYLQQDGLDSPLWACIPRTKLHLCTTPVLQSLNISRPFVLQTDASDPDHGVGKVLAQRDENNCDHPINYFTHKLQLHKQRYSTVDKESLTICLDVEVFRVYLLGCQILSTDRRPCSGSNGSKSSMPTWRGEVFQAHAPSCFVYLCVSPFCVALSFLQVHI